MISISKTILYVGIYPPTAPRDRVYLSELKRRGACVVECVSSLPGFAKYRDIFMQIRRAAKDTDVVWVGYLSPLVVPVAYLAMGKKIIYNALGSAYEAYILDRAVARRFSFKAFLFWFSDFLAFHLANLSLVESEAQGKYLARYYFVPKRKLAVVFTGVNTDIFHPDSNIEKAKVFTVAFRGMFIPATGVEVVLDAAKLLKDEPIKFWVSGWGQLLPFVQSFIKENKLTNVELNTIFLEPPELRQKLLSAHVMLGQFSKNSRLERTIQHKISEALALGMPLITRDSPSNREILQDRENCLFVPPGDPQALAGAIRELTRDVALREKISEEAQETYQNRLSLSSLGDGLERVLIGIIN